ncbi:DUF1559 domain-containing protein [Isosphaeraceae bacterium EP7]
MGRFRIAERWPLLVFGLLLLFFLPVLLQPPRHRNGRQRSCATNIRQVALGAVGYANERGEFPRGVLLDGLPPERGTSWISQCLEFLYHEDLEQAYDRSTPWDLPPNAEIAKTRIMILTCSAAETVTTAKGFPTTSYVGIAGVGADAATLESGHPRAGIFGYSRVTKISDIRDGTSNTLLVAETDLDLGSWMSGGHSTIRAVVPAQRPYIGVGRPFGGPHKNGANVAFADGSVRFVSATIAPEMIEAMATIAGGEAVSEDGMSCPRMACIEGLALTGRVFSLG